MNSGICLQFSLDKKLIVTASADATVRLWDVDNGSEIKVLKGITGLTGARISVDGKSIITASADNKSRQWDVVSLSEFNVSDIKDNGLDMSKNRKPQLSPDEYLLINDAQLSSDSRTLLTANKDWTARLSDVASGKEFRVLRGHQDEVTSGQFSPNGEIVVTGSKDKTVRLWDATSGKELQVLRGHQAEVLSAEFFPNGEIIVTAAKDGTVRLWRCEVCRDVSAIAAELGIAVGRELREEERRWFGVDNNTLSAIRSLFAI